MGGVGKGPGIGWSRVPSYTLKSWVYLNGCNKLALCEKLNLVPRATGGTVAAINVPLPVQGPEEMCFSLEHQRPSKSSEKWVIFIALQFRYTFYRQQTKRLRARKIGFIFYSALRASVALWATCRAPAKIWLAVIDFQNGEQQRSGSDKKRTNCLQ